MTTSADRPWLAAYQGHRAARAAARRDRATTRRQKRLDARQLRRARRLQRKANRRARAHRAWVAFRPVALAVGASLSFVGAGFSSMLVIGRAGIIVGLVVAGFVCVWLSWVYGSGE